MLQLFFACYQFEAKLPVLRRRCWASNSNSLNRFQKKDIHNKFPASFNYMLIVFPFLYIILQIRNALIPICFLQTLILSQNSSLDVDVPADGA